MSPINWFNMVDPYKKIQFIYSKSGPLSYPSSPVSEQPTPTKVVCFVSFLCVFNIIECLIPCVLMKRNPKEIEIVPKKKEKNYANKNNRFISTSPLSGLCHGYIFSEVFVQCMWKILCTRPIVEKKKKQKKKSIFVRIRTEKIECLY